MRATAINHVSIPATDLAESARFYTELFGMEIVPSPNFGMAVTWLRVGDRQIHLFEAGPGEAANHHFAMDVDDFEGTYSKLKELGRFGGGNAYFSKMYVLPDNGVQMYCRDPAGNLVEVVHPNIDELDRQLFGDDLRVHSELRSQSPRNMRATLWMDGEA